MGGMIFSIKDAKASFGASAAAAANAVSKFDNQIYVGRGIDSINGEGRMAHSYEAAATVKDGSVQALADGRRDLSEGGSLGPPFAAVFYGTGQNDFGNKGGVRFVVEAAADNGGKTSGLPADAAWREVGSLHVESAAFEPGRAYRVAVSESSFKWFRVKAESVKFADATGPAFAAGQFTAYLERA